MNACVKECTLYATKTMQHNIANLYAHIFFFLRSAIQWYLSRSIRRALSSFREDFYGHFEDQVSNIRSISASINREAQQGSNSEIRYTRLFLEDFREDMVIGLRGLQREAAARDYREAKAIQERLQEDEKRRLLEQDKWKKLEEFQRLMANSTRILLLGQASEFLAGEQHERIGENLADIHHYVRSLGLMGQSGLSTLQSNQSLEENLSKQIMVEGTACVVRLEQGAHKFAYCDTAFPRPQNRVDTQFISRHLEDYIDDEQCTTEHDRSAGIFVEWPVISALQEWTTAKSQMLCIVGPHYTTGQSSTSLVAAEYVESAVQSQIPVVSYFCRLPRKKLSFGKTPEAEALVSLTYALIRQLIELLPSVFNQEEGLSSQRFALLDGSLESFNHALTVLGDLLDLSPPLLFCVIDNIQELEETSTRRYLGMLIDTLRGHTKTRDARSTDSNRILKTFFTTAGRSRSLLDHLSNEELVFAEQVNTARRPGRPSTGRRSFSPSPFRDLQPAQIDE